MHVHGMGNRELVSRVEHNMKQALESAPSEKKLHLVLVGQAAAVHVGAHVDGREIAVRHAFHGRQKRL